MKNSRIAVPTLSASEIVDLFDDASTNLERRVIQDIAKWCSDLKRAKISKRNLVKTYVPFKNTKFNIYVTYSEGVLQYGAALIHRTEKGLVLVMKDYAKSGWHKIYTAHFCERYAERILKVDKTFDNGARGIMFNDRFVGIGKVVQEINEDLLEIEMKYEFGLGLGYHDNKNKISWLNTLLSNDMLRDSQIEKFREFENDLNYLNSKPNLVIIEK